MAALRLTILDHVCDQAGLHGDDLWGRSDSAAWILDGATGLWANRLVPEGSSDAAWFVAEIDAELRRSRWRAPTRDILGEAAATVAARFRSAASDLPADRSTWPAACITLVRAAEGAVELANLGDCTLLFRGRAAGVRAFGTSAITGLDRQLVAMIVDLRAQGVAEPSELWSRLVPVMREARKLRNIDGGYWVLEASGTGVAQLEQATVPADDIREFLLMTDGFYRLVDTYRVYSDEQVLAAALSGGLATLRDELRAIEDADPRCMTYPRVKVGDDATAVLGRIEQA